MKYRRVYLPIHHSAKQKRKKQARKSRQIYRSTGSPIKLKDEEILLLNAIKNEDKKSIAPGRFSASILAISLVLHVIALFALAWVKVYMDKDIEDAKIPVTFVEEQKTRVLRRSLHIRPAAALSQPTQRQPVAQQTSVHLDRGLSSDFYISDTSEKVFSEVRSLGRETLHGTNLQQPTVNLRRELTEPMKLQESEPATSQTQLGISGGYELLGKNSLTLAKPKVHIGIDADNALQRFLDAIREEIESRKKYPTSARDAGIEGRSGVRMTILKDGQLEAVEIVDSSGSAILDNAALLSVRNAAPFPPIPEETGRDRIKMRIYLVFKIA